MNNQPSNIDGDTIATLPVTNDKVNDDDEELLDLLLEDKKEQVKQSKKVAIAFKESLLGGVLFLLLSNSYVDNFIRSKIQNELYVLLAKFGVFVVLFFIVQNRFCMPN